MTPTVGPGSGPNDGTGLGLVTGRRADATSCLIRTRRYSWRSEKIESSPREP